MTPLLYAAYYDSIKCFNYLFLLENETRTKQQLIIPAIGISPKCKYVLPKGASVIEIILLRGSINCLKSYNTYMKEVKDVNKIHLNDLKITPLHMSVLCKQEISLLYFKNLAYQQQYMNVQTKDNMTILMYICYFGRFDLFSILLDNLHKFSDMEEKAVIKEQSALSFMRTMKIIRSYLRQQINLQDDNKYTAYDYIKIIFNEQLGLEANKNGKQQIYQLWNQFIKELNRGAKDKFDVVEQVPDKKEDKKDDKKEEKTKKTSAKKQSKQSKENKTDSSQIQSKDESEKVSKKDDTQKENKREEKIQDQ